MEWWEKNRKNDPIAAKRKKMIVIFSTLHHQANKVASRLLFSLENYYTNAPFKVIIIEEYFLRKEWRFRIWVVEVRVNQSRNIAGEHCLLLFRSLSYSSYENGLRSEKEKRKLPRGEKEEGCVWWKCIYRMQTEKWEKSMKFKTAAGLIW